MTEENISNLKRRIAKIKEIDWKKKEIKHILEKTIDTAFVESTKEKAKAYNKLPLTFNSSIIQSNLSEKVQKEKMEYYRKLKKDIQPLDRECTKLISSMQKGIMEPYEEIMENLGEDKSIYKLIENKYILLKEYEEKLRIRYEIAGSMQNLLTIKETEKKLIQETEMEIGNHPQALRLIHIMAKITKIDNVVKKFRSAENNISQNMCVSVESNLKELKNKGFMKLLSLIKETMNYYENLNILEEIEGDEIIQITKLSMEMFFENNMNYYSHLLTRFKTARQKAVNTAFREYEKGIIAKKHNLPFDPNIYEIQMLANWLLKHFDLELGLCKELELTKVNELGESQISVADLTDIIFQQVFKKLLKRVTQTEEKAEIEGSLHTSFKLICILEEKQEELYGRAKEQFLSVTVQTPSEEDVMSDMLFALFEKVNVIKEWFNKAARINIERCEKFRMQLLTQGIQDYGPRVIEVFHSLIINDISIILKQFDTSTPFTHLWKELLVDNLVLPFIEICQNLESNSQKSIFSLLNVYQYVFERMEEYEVVEEQAMLIRSKVLQLLERIITNQETVILTYLGINSIPDIQNLNALFLTAILKKFYDLVFEFHKNLQDKEGPLYVGITHQQLSKQLMESLSLKIINIYNIIYNKAKQMEIDIQIYNPATIKTCLA